MVLLSFTGILLFSTLLSVIAVPLDGSGVKTKISRRAPPIEGSTDGKQPGKTEFLIELLRQYDPAQSYLPPNSFKKSGTQTHPDSHADPVKQSVSPSRLVAPPVEGGLLPVIHLDLPPMWQEKWSLLFSTNGWCRAITSVKGRRIMEDCPTSPQGRKTIVSFSGSRVKASIANLGRVSGSVVHVASSVDEEIGGDVEYLNNIMKGPINILWIGKVPETWIESYESMHEVIIHGNGEWHGPTKDGKWEYYDPARSLWFTYDHAPQPVEEHWNKVQKMHWRRNF
ncbi:hypothetical protein F5890DRAFT_1532183 [Lentinula detonsa]|uniref:Uncharacterized protein n=1 Tax=Lentinula detonsa TaxID=2804962 RepID=A0AA38UQX3_9AGAR|nr:hypothetical protein F5890DRAFT_1532183 [Lentinula detonsa]